MVTDRFIVRALNVAEPGKFVATVRWIRKVEREDAKWKSKAGIYTTTHIRASLDGRPATIAFLEEAFDVNVRDYVR